MVSMEKTREIVLEVISRQDSPGQNAKRKSLPGNYNVEIRQKSSQEKRRNSMQNNWEISRLVEQRIV